MQIKGFRQVFKSGLVTLLTGMAFLLPAKNAFSDANLSSTTASFVSADAANRPDYMDSAGVWNGAAEVTNTTGDTFRLTVTNSESGSNPTEIQDNTAYGVAITADVQAGFRLPSPAFTVNVTDLSDASVNCPVVSATAAQPGGTGAQIIISPVTAGSPADIPPACSYQFDLGLTTTTVAPFVVNGNYNVDFTVNYSNFDSTPANPSVSQTVIVEVRTGDIAISKVDTSATPVADGAPATFTVSVISAGQGGIFNAVITDTLSADFDAASLVMSSSSGGVFTPPNVFSIPYIAPNSAPVVVDIVANVQVDASAASCPALDNRADAIERTGNTDSSIAAVAFDLQEPLLTFSAPDIVIPLNAGPTTYSIVITNSGNGTAKNISLAVPGVGTDLDSFGITVTSPGWVFNSPTDVFTFNGTLLSGATETLTFTLFTAMCPPPPGGVLNWSLNFENVCGTSFSPAVQSSDLSAGNVPAVTIDKTVSAGILNVGDPGSYTVNIAGTDLAAISDGDNTNNNDFSVSDIFPAGVQNIEIPLIPAGTEVEVQGVGTFTGAVPAGSIPEGGTIFWRGDVDVLGASASLGINFDGGSSGFCPTGSIVNNDAIITSTCAINELGNAGFILNEIPFTGSIAVAGGPFEAGAPDTNNTNRDEPREGEHIPFAITYDFPAGYEGGTISWSNLSFTASLRTGTGTGAPLILTNNRNSVLLTVTTPTGATACTQTPLTPGTDFVGGDGVSQLAINLAVIPSLCSVGSIVDDISVLLEYVATSPEGTLAGSDPYTDDPINEENIGTYVEVTNLTIVGATPGCTGNPVFTQAVSVTIERADLDLDGDINGGSDIEVCSVVPVNVNLNELVADTTADNLLFNLGLNNLQIVDVANNASTNVDADITRSGGFQDFDLISPPVDNQGPVDYQFNPITKNLSGPGTLSFNARVLDTAATFNATVSFDSKHTSPDGGGDADQDYTFSFPFDQTAVNFRQAQLDVEMLPPAIILRDQTQYSFKAHIINIGGGDAVGGRFEITLPPEMVFNSASSTPVGITPSIAGQVISWNLSQLGDLKAGEFIDLDIIVDITQKSCFSSIPPSPAQDEISSLTDWGCGMPNLDVLPNTPQVVLPTPQLTLSHDLNNSFCELCEEGEIHLFVRNTGGLSLTNIDVLEDLQASGLQLVAGSVSCIADEGACTVAQQPVQVGTTIPITPTHIPLLSNLFSAFSPTAGTPQQIEIIFRVNRLPGQLEGIVVANLAVTADAQFGLFCDQLSTTPTPVRIDALQNQVTIPLRQPAPTIQKQARNVTANQNIWTDTVRGGTADEVIWRIDLQNLGNADLQDLKLDDIISQLGAAINFDFHSLCPNEADADSSAANSSAQGACKVMTDPQQIVPPLDDIDFSGTAVDIVQGGNQFIYLVGTILNQCENMLNTSTMDWGCAIEPPVGGVVALSGFLPPPPAPTDNATLSAKVNPAGLVITQTITGVNPANGNILAGSPVGSKGVVQLTITNNTGGTIRSLQFTDVLPANYSYDSTRPIQPRFNFTPAFLDYLGNVDTITEDVSSTPTQPVFNLTTTAPANVAPLAIHNNVLRHGDVLVVEYGIVRSSLFDTSAHPAVREEVPGPPVAPLPAPLPAPGFDVIYPAAGVPDNTIIFSLDDTCDVNAPFPDELRNQTLTVDPEDLDVDINSGDPDLLFILGNPTDALDLTVEMANRGGNAATDYQLIVTIGSGLNVVGVPANCAINGTVAAPTVPVRPILDPPPVLPDASIYLCTQNDPKPVGGATDNFTFSVQKNNAGFDLTFRADAVGEVTLFDGTPTTNNYSFDSVLARIIGFNLNKTVQSCTENTPTGAQAANVQIGEDCTYLIQASWFGFLTPGFGQISIGEFNITDTIPPGQGFISALTMISEVGSTDLQDGPAAPGGLPANELSSPNPANAPDPITLALLQYNTDTNPAGIDKPITANVTITSQITTRILNNNNNNRNEAKTDTLAASFEVDFDGPGAEVPILIDDTNTTNYPLIADRQAVVTIFEPNLLVTKRVCNRTLQSDGVCDAGNIADPTDFGDFTAAVTGDGDDVYDYIIRIYNDSNIPSVASAFDSIALDMLDTFATPALVDLSVDGRDNNRDGVIDDAAETGIGTYVAPQITFTPGAAPAIPLLNQIDAGQAIDLFYQVAVSPGVVPGQVISNTVNTAYDSLLGDFGSQTDPPQRPNDDPAGARTYAAAPSTATITIANVVAPVGSKSFINKANLTDVPFVGPVPYLSANASIGEEVEVELLVQLPVSTLKNFTIQDVLPAGLSCIEAGNMFLPTLGQVPAGEPYFLPGGTYPATGCDAATNTPTWVSTVDQLLVVPVAPFNRSFNLRIPFIARLDNNPALIAGGALVNGGGSTAVNVSFLDQGNNLVFVPLGAATVDIKEPNIQFTIRSGTLNPTPPPLVNAITSADASDIYTVEVVIDNNSPVPANVSPAYNLQIVADFSATPGATFVAGSLGAANFTFDPIASSPTQIVLDYNLPKLDPAGNETISFQIALPDNVQPHDILQTALTANYSSLASNAVALNATGLIGADNAPDGMRLYSTTQTDTTASVPGLINSKIEAPLSDPVPTIGARKRFQLQINFPEGLTQGNATNPLTVVDILSGPGSTTSYVFENNAAFVIAYEFSGIQSINGITDVAQFPTQITAPLDGSTGAVTWTINGDVITDTEDDLDGVANVINPYIRISYYARIDDNPATVAGGRLVNSVRSNYSDRANGARVSPPAIFGPITIVEPDLRMSKLANATINFGIAETYTLDIRNDGGSTAWNATISDVFIEPAMGGVCDTPPANIQATIVDDMGVLQRTLVENTDFNAIFAPDPACTLTFNMLTTEASIESTWHLVINYDVTLDLNNVNGTMLDNIAGATLYYSLEQVNDSARTYTNVLSPDFNTANAALPFEDFEDAFRILVGAPQLTIIQSVVDNATVPGVLAPPILNPFSQPGNIVRYQIHIVNEGPVAVPAFDLIEDLDLLNPGGGFYEAGTLVILDAANGNDFSNPVGGSKATGLIDIRDLNIAAANAGNTDELVIHYDIKLGPVINSGTRVLNQAQASLTDFTQLPVLSDDPDPIFPGDADPTVLTVNSVPTFRLEKTSQDITDDPGVLLAAELLRYTITAQNIGAEDSVNTLLRDQIPANTTYVANSTILNGVAVADPSDGVSPLQDGLLINAPENLTAGFMRAGDDPVATATNIATVSFTVMLDPNVVNSTVISNQAFVGGAGAGSDPFAEQPSDDPNTEIAGDPTRNVVGNVAVLDVQKVVELFNDAGADGQVNIGDTLRYTITINNAGTIDATDVVLTDVVPPNTSYVAASTTLNGLPVPDGGGASLPIIGGLPVSSDDLTPPLPPANQGTISPMQSATLVFDVTVNPLTPDGTIISNQALVTSANFPDEPSDEDGNDTNGDQPTDIIVGNTQKLSISKDVFVVGGGTAQPGATLQYIISVENTGFSPIDLSDMTQVIQVVDDIDQLNLISYVPGSARLNGVTDPNISFIAPRLYVDYGSLKRVSRNPLFNPGEKFTIRYLATIDANAVQGTNISNTAGIDWGAQSFVPVNNATPINCNGASQNLDACSIIDLAVGGAPGVATVSGSLWHDFNFDEIQDAAEPTLAGWQVEIYFGAGTVNPGDLLDTVFTDATGNYSILGLLPNDAGPLEYALRFRPPLASTDTASLGEVAIDPSISATTAPSSLLSLAVARASHSANINLPIQPNGVIFNSILRTPVTGAVLQMTNPAGIVLPASCFDDPAQQNQRTIVEGFYKFDLNFSQSGICNPGMDYTINVFPPDGFIDYDNDPSTPVVSLIIPPAVPISDVAFDAVSCIADANGSTTECEIQPLEIAPPVDVPPRTPDTNYYQKFLFSSGIGDSQIFNNHIAVDPSFNNAISISKTSPLVNVTRGQLVPYDITLTNSLDAPFFNLDIEDLFPAGFKYISGSGRVQFGSGPFIKVEPVHPPGTLNLNWIDVGKLDSKSTLKLKLLLVVGSGVGEGEYVNRAQARNTITGLLESGQASSTVRVVPDPTFDCSDVIGKIFDDKNLNAYQDEGEEGLGGVRVVTARGLEITSDAHGRFHVTCAVVPNPDRGSNFILKLDERSLPSGYRMTTENPRVVRATRGKMVKFNFGAAIHRVVRLDMADAVFEPETTDMRPQWLPRLDILITELAKDPSLLRLSYLAENESESLANDRLDAVKDEIESRWEDLDCCYQLTIETEIFWRKGGPPDKGEFDD
ncbi:MAG TPA: DUF11 domain-containing protein [Gammaproteobacteria bacterium]|nr:DUF11 domain-containing protein [Gammaproteobacteria bacterium]